jgi:hypothetical protein
VLGYVPADNDSATLFRNGNWTGGATWILGYGWFTPEPEPEIGEALLMDPDVARTWSRNFSVWP